jgi:hypothetical protein
VTWLREVGDHVALPPQGNAGTARVGFFIVTADDPARARARVDDLVGRLTLTVASPDRRP